MKNPSATNGRNPGGNAEMLFQVTASVNTTYPTYICDGIPYLDVTMFFRNFATEADSSTIFRMNIPSVTQVTPTFSFSFRATSQKNRATKLNSLNKKQNI